MHVDVTNKTPKASSDKQGTPAWTNKKACLDRLRSNDVYLTAGTVSISAQTEAAVKACEAETARVGQDYYSALSASSPAAAKGPAAGKSPAPAKGKPAKEEPIAPAEVVHLDICCKVQESRQFKACQCSRDEQAVDRWRLACSVSMLQSPQRPAINATAADLHSTHNACCCMSTDMPPCAVHMRHPPIGAAASCKHTIDT